MNKAYKFRLYPNDIQQSVIEKTFNCVRFMHNKMLTDKIKYYFETGKTLKNTPAQYKKEFPFLKEVDSLALANVQMNLQTAFNTYFSKPGMLFPRFKTKKRCRKSYTTNCVNGNIVISGDTIKLPKIGHVKINLHRAIPDGYKLKSVTVSRDAKGNYYASILFEYEPVEPEIPPESIIGLAYSKHGLYTDINGKTVMYPEELERTAEKYRREKKRLANMKNGSKNREKQRIKTKRIIEKLERQRTDFLHKQSRQIANAYDRVCVKESSGSSGSDYGWTLFKMFLQYKLNDAGKKLIKVDELSPQKTLYSGKAV